MARAVGIALAGLALTLVALMFDAAPLFVSGVAFAVLGLAAPAAVALSARGTSVRRVLDQRRATEDEPLEASIVVEGGWPGLGSRAVVEPLARATVAVPRGQETVRVVLRFARRGRRALDPPSLIVRDPLELCARTIRGREPTSELLVLPRTTPIELLDDPHGAEGALADGLRNELPVAVEVDGLRPYRAGTPASRIHWPAVARGRGLLERRLRAEADTRPLVVLDARSPAAEEDLDAAVRAAASLVLALARSGGCGLLLPGDRRPTTLEADLRGWPGAHARLALVEETSAPPAISGARNRLGAVFYVSGQRLDRLPVAADGVARGSALLVLPASLEPPTGPGGRPIGPRLAVAGCYGYVVRARGGAGRRPRGTAVEMRRGAA